MEKEKKSVSLKANVAKKEKMKILKRKNKQMTNGHTEDGNQPKKKKSLMSSDLNGSGSKGDDAGTVGLQEFNWMISPFDVKEFEKSYWEQKPLHIKREDGQGYYKHLFSTKALETIIREKHVLYGKHLDITSYDGKRETHNPNGRVYPAVMWDYYNNGSSVRMINPQYFDDKIWKICSHLQEYFHNMVGANVYLTPPGTQGFAPHWDDVDVFMLQIEGKKHWRIYDPEDDKLARFSSPNFSQEDLKEPIMDMVLEAGDLLYLPRGTIHQGNCLPDAHSLHVTISTYQLNSWTDLLEKLLPAALAVASQQNPAFREGLPKTYFQSMGIVNSDKETPERHQFKDKVKDLMGQLFDYAPVDGAVDQLAKRFMHDALPPCLSDDERRRTVQADGERWNAKKECVVNRVEIDPDTRVRLVRRTAIRIVQEDDSEKGNKSKEPDNDSENEEDDDVVHIYYSTENTREYHEKDEQFLVLDAEHAPAVEHLIQSYPKWTRVEDLPIPDQQDRMKIVGDLWERSILITRKTLECFYDNP